MQSVSVSFTSQWYSIWVAKLQNCIVFSIRSHRNSELCFWKKNYPGFISRLNLVENMIFSFNRWVESIFKNYTWSWLLFSLLYGFTIMFSVTSVCLKCFWLHTTSHFSVRLAIWLSQLPNTGTGITGVKLYQPYSQADRS